MQPPQADLPPTRTAYICISLSLLTRAGAAQSGAAPTFEEYPVKEMFTGTPAAPQLATALERTYRTRIREGVSKGWGVIVNGKDEDRPGPNFAGHYIAIQWGCGSPCIMMVFVDAGTGRIYYPPLSFGTEGNQRIGLPMFGLGPAPLEFRLNSSLLTMNACPENGPNAPCYRYFFLWRENRWRLLRREPLENPFH